MLNGRPESIPWLWLLSPSSSSQHPQRTKVHLHWVWPPPFGQSLASNRSNIISRILTHRVGNLLGKGKAKRAGLAANTSFALTIVYACFARQVQTTSCLPLCSDSDLSSSTMFFVLRHKWAYLFNEDPGKRISTSFLSASC